MKCTGGVEPYFLLWMFGELTAALDCDECSDYDTENAN